MTKKSKITHHKKVKLPRKHRISFLFNDEEFKAFNRHTEKFHIQNQSRFIRETVMQEVLKQLGENYPTLF